MCLSLWVFVYLVAGCVFVSVCLVFVPCFISCRMADEPRNSEETNVDALNQLC